jgi:glucosamine 6-phosphate synthetase-like amidotransferase/phosphosugar isomerase protein
MCGVFGFITREGAGPDVGRLKRIAIETQSRGDHAFGLAWVGADGRLHAFKRPGPATANLNDLDRCEGALALVGHCRWATHGTAKDNRNNHPHAAGRGWLVHNGVVRNHATLARHFKLKTTTECDSEVLGLLIARASGPLEIRAGRTAQLVDGPLVMLGVWSKPARLLFVRRGNPLCFSQTEVGGYFGSLRGQLPGEARAVPDDRAGVILFRDGAVEQRAVSIAE